MKSKVWVFGGLLLITVSLFLFLSNVIEEKKAQKNVEKVLQEYQKWQSTKEDYSNEKEPTIIKIEDNTYIGILEIPALNISLPVMNEWNYEKLKISPGRYAGSILENNLIIAGHNYKSHFGKLANLQKDDKIIFTDVEKNKYEYQVTEIIHIDETDQETMINGEWDLTLFTCTLDGKKRLTIRCKKS